MNHALMIKEQGDQMQWFLEKQLKNIKKKMDSSILSTHHIGKWIVL